uniref:Uncharacterized protein n=1 Tax=Onchocerca volvulus TaxID=6282 RepID=A0A8R1U1D6_ONCVO
MILQIPNVKVAENTNCILLKDFLKPASFVVIPNITILQFLEERKKPANTISFKNNYSNRKSEKNPGSWTHLFTDQNIDEAYEKIIIEGMLICTAPTKDKQVLQN